MYILTSEVIRPKQCGKIINDKPKHNMPKVTSTVSVSFPKLGWGITAGEVRELPEGEEAQARILQEPGITLVDEKKPITSNKSSVDTK